MPHLSKHKISNELKDQINKKIIDFLTDTKLKTRKDIFYEIFTYTERLMVAKRIAMIYMISKNIPPYSISNTLKVSPSTVARFAKGIEKGKYQITASWIKNYKSMPKILELLFDVASVPFDVQTKSLKQIIEDAKR